MQTTTLKPWLLVGVAVGSLLCLGLHSGCKSPQPGTSARVRSLTKPPLNQGAAAAVFQDSAKGNSAFLAAIPISCPAEPKYRLSGFSMKCDECHVPRRSSEERPEDQTKRKAQVCAANLKYIGLAAHAWASNHNGHLPGTFASMANELRTPTMAACPEQSWDAAAQKSKYQYLPPALRRLEPKPLEVPTWYNIDRHRASYQIVSPTALRRLPEATYVRCKIHGTVLRANGTVISPSPDASQMRQAKRKTVIPRIASIAEIKIGASTQEDLAKRWGEGLSVTGGHPNSGRVWRVRDTPWVVRTDGFEYSDHGLVVDSLEISEAASPLQDAPCAKLDQKQFSWLGQITPGMTRSQLLEILKREHLPALATESGFEVYADGFHCLKGLDLMVWTVAFEFDPDKLRRLTINATEHR